MSMILKKLWLAVCGVMLLAPSLRADLTLAPPTVIDIGTVRSVEFSPNDKYIAAWQNPLDSDCCCPGSCGSEQARGLDLTVVDAQTRQIVFTHKNNTAVPWFSPDSTKILTTGKRGIHVWNLQTKQKEASFQKKNVHPHGFLEDGRKLVIESDAEDKIFIWDIANNSTVTITLNTEVRDMDINHVRNEIVMLGEDETIRIFSIDGRERKRIYLEGDDPDRVEVSKNGEKVVTCFCQSVRSEAQAPINVFDALSGALISKLSPGEQFGEVDAQGKYIITATDPHGPQPAKRVRIWRVDSGKEVRTFKTPYMVDRPDLSNNGTLALVNRYHHGEGFHDAIVFNIATGERALLQRKYPMYDIEFSNDSRRIAAATDVGIAIWTLPKEIAMRGVRRRVARG